jgi:riboflavin synthase
MFTGLVAAKGRLAERTPRGPGARLVLDAALDGGPFSLGESIAVDGVCLSVDALAPNGFEADASAETLARTTLGHLAEGASVHLERALRAGSPMGGHMMTGHVDGIGTLVSRRPMGDAVWMALSLPPELARFVAQKGSIAVDGVSLTVNAVSAAQFEVMIVPHTLAKTNLATLSPGESVNVEVDLIARYVARLMSAER